MPGATKKDKSVIIMKGSKHTPFENDSVLLDFLLADEPEHYVFRGQIKEYDGPLLPSGIRDKFIPFKGSSGPSGYAGMTTTQSTNLDTLNAKRRDFPPTYIAKTVDDGRKLWDLSEDDYQTGFRTFFNQPHRKVMKKLGNVLRESAVPSIGCLIGEEIGSLLSQQYGFTSTAIDASTDPAVAMFFATHSSPFYNLMRNSENLGVIYRWPKELAMVAQDLLLQLEGANFESIISSFKGFVEESDDLELSQDEHVHYVLEMEKNNRSEFIDKQSTVFVSNGARRCFKAFRFPSGAYNQSRMGRQRAALLWPHSEAIEVYTPGKTDIDYAALIGDLMDTHHGEKFYFQHSNTPSVSESINKFILWPSPKPHCSAQYLRLELQAEHHLDFEDYYLEMMLRFFSSCSPCQIILAEKREPVNPNRINVASGVVDLGYLINTSDVSFIVNGLMDAEEYIKIPLQRYIAIDELESFRDAFTAAICYMQGIQCKGLS